MRAVSVGAVLVGLLTGAAVVGQPPEPERVPRLTLDELAAHPESEVAQVILPLKVVGAAGVAKDVEQMIGPSGKAVALEDSNTLVLTGTVGDLRRVCKAIQDADVDKNPGAYLYRCRYIKAGDAERILKSALADPCARSESARLVLRSHFVTSDERENVVIFGGLGDTIDKAKEGLQRIDKAPDQPVRVNTVLRVYEVQTGNADVIAKQLQEHYKDAPSVRVKAISNNAIIVYASPEDQADIAAFIIGPPR